MTDSAFKAAFGTTLDKFERNTFVRGMLKAAEILLDNEELQLTLPQAVKLLQIEATAIYEGKKPIR